MDSLASISVSEWPLALDVQSLANRLVRLDLSDSGRILASVEVRSTLVDQIQQRQFEDQRLCDIREQVRIGEANRATLDSDGVMRFEGRI